MFDFSHMILILEDFRYFLLVNKKFLVSVSEINWNFSIIDAKFFVILNVAPHSMIMPPKFSSFWLNFRTNHKVHGRKI